MSKVDVKNRKEKSVFLDGYTNITVRRTGVLACPTPKFGVLLEVEKDLSPLFPYLNAVVSAAQYFDEPERISFLFEGVQCTLYAHEIIAAVLQGHDHAKRFGQSLLNYLNRIHASRESLEPDYRKFKPLAPLEIYKILPRTNCGDCGLPSCLAFAGALSRGSVSISQCPQAVEPMEAKAVYPVVDGEGRVTGTVELQIPLQSRQDEERNEELLSFLTAREVEILQFLARGLTNPEIAEQLFISPHTVKTHVTHIYEKLGVKDRAQAAVIAARNHLI